MHFLAEYFLFFAKAITLAAVALAVLGGAAAIGQRRKKTADAQLEVTDLNEQYDQMEKTLVEATLTPQQRKQRRKAQKKSDKARASAAKKAAKSEAKVKSKSDSDSQSDSQAKSTATSDLDSQSDSQSDSNSNSTEVDGDKPIESSSASSDATVSQSRRRIYVLDFVGDLRATPVASLRREISAILTLADARDEVLVRLESGGGVVHGYGLAASQLQRIREHNIKLTVSVDKVAASGGYMMACVADQLIAAPFAFIGSIGVLLQTPNFHRLLKKNDIDFDQLHAGEYKRTLTLFGENTEPAREKAQQELQEMHELFKQHVKTQRPSIDIEQVATGEFWLGARALQLKLIDRLQTGDDYLMQARNDAQLVQVCYAARKTLLERMAAMTSADAAWRGVAALLSNMRGRDS